MPKTKAFKKLENSVRETYLFKKVPLKWQNRYGKVYGAKDVESLAYAIARSKDIKIEKGK